MVTAPALTLSLNRSLPAQIVERGQFKDEDILLVREQLLKSVNEERSAAGFSTLQLDELACRVAEGHARDMADGGFLSHWGRDGKKVYLRYTLAGGTDAVQENCSAADNIPSLTAAAVAKELDDMHLRMLNEVPPGDGHRKVILARQHTHVGFGIALGQRKLRLVEIFVGRYLKLDPIPRKADRQAKLVMTGRLLNQTHLLQTVEVCHEPLPTPPKLEWLRVRRSYSLPVDCVSLRPKAPQGALYTDGTRGDFEWHPDGQFRVPISLAKDEPGIYTIVFWLRTAAAETAFVGAQVCLEGN